MNEDPIRVLAVTNLWPEGRGYRGIFVLEQIEALRRLGIEVDVEVLAQRRGRADYLLGMRRVRRRIRCGAYDLAHFHYGLASPTLWAARGLPTVLSLYGSDVNVRWQRAITRLGVAQADERIYVSRNLAQRMDDPQGHVVPCGVDLSVFRPPERRVVNDPPVVLFGADPGTKSKGYNVFRAVLDELRSRGTPVREMILPEPGLTREAVARKFAAADVLLFTSRPGTEGSPGVVKEAVAMGLPVVTVEVGDVREVLDGTIPSSIVDFGGNVVETLADGVEKVLAADRRSDGPRQADRFNLVHTAEAVLEVYRTALKAFTSPAP